MKGKNNLQIGKYLGQIGNDGKNLSAANDSFTADSNVVRIAAEQDSYIYNKNNGQGTDGILVPAHFVEYFKVEIGDEITLISGKVNISSVF